MKLSELNMRLILTSSIKCRIRPVRRVSLCLVAIGLFSVGLTACFENTALPPGPNSAATPQQATTTSPMDNDRATEGKTSAMANTPVTIDAIEYFGWWWSDVQFNDSFDLDNPPPKKSYVKLEDWNVSQPSEPHPSVMDVVCRVANKGGESINISVTALANFKIESYEIVVSDNSGKSLDEILEKTPWTNKQQIGKAISLELAPGEVR